MVLGLGLGIGLEAPVFETLYSHGLGLEAKSVRLALTPGILQTDLNCVFLSFIIIPGGIKSQMRRYGKERDKRFSKR